MFPAPLPEVDHNMGSGTQDRKRRNTGSGPAAAPAAAAAAGTELAVPMRVQVAMMRGILKLERQMATVRSASRWTYMIVLDKFPLMAPADLVAKADAAEFKRLTDAKKYEDREALGPLHLRVFDSWAGQVKAHLQAEQLITTRELEGSMLALLDQWLNHCRTIKVRGVENEARVFRKAKAHKRTQMKMEVAILPGPLSEQMFMQVIEPYMLAKGCRRMAGTEPRGDNARTVQDFLDEQEL